MNVHYMLALFDDGVKTCGVVFQDELVKGLKPWEDVPAARKPRPESVARIYTYKHRFLDLKKDELLVVQTPNGEYKVVQVVRVDDAPDLDPDSKIEYKWVVQRLNTADYEAQCRHDLTSIDSVRHLQREHHRASARAALLQSAPQLAALMQSPPPGWAVPVVGAASTPMAEPSVAVAPPSDVLLEPVLTPECEASAIAALGVTSTARQRQAFCAGMHGSPGEENPYSQSVQPHLFEAWQKGASSRI